MARVAVEAVAGNGVADAVEMDADLVPPAGLRVGLDESVCWESARSRCTR